jgi:ABC-type antimicrobial peptide transport system permease subunit
VLPGLLVGIAAAIVGNRLLVSLLFEVKPADPAMLTTVSIGIIVASFGASFLPALRASGLDPLVSLRQD